MSQVLRIALPGKDVKHGRVDEMAVDSRYSSPKIDTAAAPPHAGIIYLSWNNTAAIATGTTKLLYNFPHNYNFVPTVIATYKFDNGANVLRGTLPFQYGTLGVIVMEADETNVNLRYYSTDNGLIPAFTMQVRFYVMAEHGYE